MTPDDIKLHIERLYSYASPRIVNELELDEVLTNTFSTALQATGPTGTSDKHDSIWLIGILRKQICAHYRKKYQSEKAIAEARRSAQDILKQAFDIPQKISGLETNVLSRSDNPAFWKAFNECVGMLSEFHAEIFVLRDLEDISVEEVSGIFGLSQSDVLELIYRARMILLACVAKSLKSKE